MASIVRKRKTGNKGDIKAASHKINDPISVSYFFFTQASTLVPPGFTANLSQMLSIYSDSKENLIDCLQFSFPKRSSGACPQILRDTLN